MTRVRLLFVCGGLAAVVGGVLAYVGGPIARAALVAEVILLFVVLHAVHVRSMRQVRESLAALRASSRDVAKETRRHDRDVARLRRDLAAVHKALDHTIAQAVQRIDDKVRHQVNGLATAIKDAEIESGLAAMNRYASLAEHGLAEPGLDAE